MKVYGLKGMYDNHRGGEDACWGTMCSNRLFLEEEDVIKAMKSRVELMKLFDCVNSFVSEIDYKENPIPASHFTEKEVMDDGYVMDEYDWTIVIEVFEVVEKGSED